MLQKQQTPDPDSEGSRLIRQDFPSNDEISLQWMEIFNLISWIFDFDGWKHKIKVEKRSEEVL